MLFNLFLNMLCILGIVIVGTLLLAVAGFVVFVVIRIFQLIFEEDDGGQ
jgi:hypothetical protein